ncbi:MAG: hypothetical protein EA377_03895 [Phycisphaerales bacterium]|nr:MAG: hypothetical protein EA377_03895 [Phycisphaerales bacterium]
MNRTLAIAGRELRAYFLTPGGYIIIALFLLITGGVFVFAGFGSGEVASMRTVFGLGTWLLTFVAPAITMRLFAEEFRLGTFEALMTSPVREIEVVLGKFLGATGMLIAILAPTLIYVIALEVYGRPDYGEIACGYLGLMLAGTAYLACGTLASTLTNSQTVAFLMALFFWLVLGIGTKLLPQHLEDPWSRIVFLLDPDVRLRDFTIGLLDTANVVFFLTVAAFFLVAAVFSLNVRRS